MVRLLHTADLHIDTPFTGSGLTRDQVLTRRGELVAVFRALMLLARERKVDLVLIAGDLFEAEYVNPASVSRIFSSIAELAPIPVFISPGNHDHIHSGSPYVTEKLSPNLHVFNRDEFERVELLDIGVAVHGLAFTAPHETRQLLKEFPTAFDGLVNLVLCHGAYFEGEPGQAGKYMPISLDDLQNTGADYCALGHYHRKLEAWRDERGLRAAYPGSPEPLRFGHTGKHGAFIIEIDPLTKAISDEFVVTQRRKYHQISLDLSDCEDAAALDGLINTELRKPELSDGLVELVLRGSILPGFNIQPTDYLDVGRDLFVLRIDDRTRPDFDLDAIASESTARGAFCRRMLQQLEAADPEKKQVVEEALLLGLSAFEGHNIEEIPL